METCTVTAKSIKGNAGRRKVALDVLVGGIKKQIGPYKAALVCDVEIGDTFEWDGQSIGTLKHIESATLVIPAPDKFHAGRVRHNYSVIEVGGAVYFVAANPNKKNGVTAIAKGGNDLCRYSSRQNFLDGLPMRTVVLENAIQTLGGLVDQMEDEEFLLDSK
jgi:hypothetical protein